MCCNPESFYYDVDVSELPHQMPNISILGHSCSNDAAPACSMPQHTAEHARCCRRSARATRPRASAPHFTALTRRASRRQGKLHANHHGADVTCAAAATTRPPHALHASPHPAAPASQLRAQLRAQPPPAGATRRQQRLHPPPQQQPRQ